jgi:hypothetical protein
LDAHTKLYLELIEKEYVTVPPEIKNINYEVVFEVPAKQLNDFLKQVDSYNKDYGIIFESLDNSIKIYNTGKFKFERKISATGVKKGKKVKFGMPLINAIGNVSEGLFKIHMDENVPMKIENNTEKDNITYFVAPTSEE